MGMARVFSINVFRKQQLQNRPFFDPGQSPIRMIQSPTTQKRNSQKWISTKATSLFLRRTITVVRNEETVLFLFPQMFTDLSHFRSKWFPWTRLSPGRFHPPLSLILPGIPALSGKALGAQEMRQRNDLLVDITPLIFDTLNEVRENMRFRRIIGCCVNIRDFPCRGNCHKESR